MDPVIRNIAKIKLEENILIIDEGILIFLKQAHNIESCAMDAASLDLKERDLVDTKNNLAAAVEYVKNHPLKSFSIAYESIMNWSKSSKSLPLPEKESGCTSKIWTGYDTAKIFESFGFNKNK